MKLSKLNQRSPLEHLPQSKKLAQKRSLQIFLIKISLSLLALLLFYYFYFHSNLVYHFLDSFWDDIKFATQRFLNLSHWDQFLLLAPAILFDSTRYYLTNSIVFFVEGSKKIFSAFRKHPYEDPAKCPWVSVIVPVYNEGKTIRLTLDSLLENNYTHFELIVVDDCSTDDTSLICRQYAKEGKINYILKKQREGKPHSLNYGRQFAKGEIIIHVDGDSIFHRDSILEVVKPFISPKVGAVAANLKVMNDRENLVTGLQAMEYGQCISVQRRWLSMTDTLQIASGAFSAFRKEILDKLQGVDTETGEDLDITLKVRKMGYKIAFAPRAIGLTEVPNTWGSLARQRILWDRCYIRINLRKHFNIINLRHFRFGDFLAGVTDIIFNLFLILIFPIYILVVALYFRPLLLYILMITYLYYTLMQFVQFLIVILFSEDKKRDWVFIFYVPLFFLYSCYLRTVRMFAYFLEIFRAKSFKKGYFPEKIWKSMPEYW